MHRPSAPTTFDATFKRVVQAAADRISTVAYPTGETVTNAYNGRGLPYSVSGSVVGSLAASTLYNNLGQVTEINLNNGLRTTLGYWDVGGPYDTSGGYYGRLWNIRAFEPGQGALLDTRHTWDASGNLTQREDYLATETETFGYDFLDRLISVSGPYSSSYAYDQIGNMTDRGSQTLTWDVENRPVSVTGGASFVYDGDGDRGKKTEGGETVLYVNMYYEKNLMTGVVTTYYYLGNRLVAKRQGTTLEYVHQDHLTGTALVTDTSGNQVGGIKYYPYGDRRNSQGTLPDKQFTGQRLDGTGLYYYNARYYDPEIGRFVSADAVVPEPLSPQAWNRYSYALNNPLTLVDPTGHYVVFTGGFSYRSGRNRQKLERAWEMLKWAATDIPKLAEMIQKAEESESLVMIGWRPIGEYSVVWGDERLGKQSIWIDTVLREADIRVVATVMAHELSHADEGRQVDSIQEEMEAYILEYDVAKRLALPVRGTTLEELRGLDALHTTDLQAGTRVLEQLGVVYPWIPLQRIGVSDPTSELTLFGFYRAWYELFGERAPW